MPQKYILKLYLEGDSENAKKTLLNLEEMLNSNQLKGMYKLQIIDVVKDPERAFKDRIMVTPTLIKQLPLPVKRLIGDLSNKGNVLLGLDLTLSDL